MSCEQEILSGKFFGEAAIPAEVYDEAPYTRNTALQKMGRSPAHYLSALVERSPDTAAFLFGRALHAMVLEPHANKVIASPKLDRRKNADKEAYDKFSAENVGKIIVPGDDYNKLSAMAAKILESDTGKALLTGGYAEHSLFWQHESGVKCKARLDYIQPEQRIIVDLKTTSKAATLNSFARSLADYGYAQQAYLYLDGARRVWDASFDFVFLAIETEPPFEFAFYRINEAALEKAGEQVEQNLRRLAECESTNHWPGYSHEIQDISLPSWAW